MFSYNERFRRRGLRRRKGDEMMDFVIQSHVANGKLLFDRVHGISDEVASEPEAISPPVDVVEDRDAYRFSIDLPGLKSDSLEVKVEDETLVINAERDEPVRGKDDQVHRAERHYGHIHRHFGLPSDVGHDAIKAAYKDGVLEVMIAKLPEAKAVRVEVAYH
jgi:HSP20 family protein